MEKYLVASKGNTLDSKVSARFGHSSYFLVINPETMEYDSFAGIADDESQHIGRFLSQDIKKVIVGNIGPSSYREVTSYGCAVYLCRNMPVLEAVKKVTSGDIPLLKEPTLKKSIHSARKEGQDEFREEIRRGKGMGKGMGKGIGKGMGKGMKGGKGGG